MFTIVLLVVLFLASPFLPDKIMGLGALLVAISACLQLMSLGINARESGWRGLSPPLRLEDAPPYDPLRDISR